MSTGSDHAAGRQRLAELVAREEQRAWQVRLMRALWVGLAGWSAYLLVDLVIVFGFGVAPPAYIGVRIAPALVLGGLLVLLRRRELGPRVLRALEVGVFSCGTSAIGVLALVHTRGIESGNIAGAALVVLTYGVTLGSPVRHALLPVSAMVISIPIVLGAGAALVPRVAEQLSNPAALMTFAASYTVVIAGGALTLVGGHYTSGLRQQVAESRSIGRYRLRKRIGKGGMGEVWSAFHAGLGRDVALKLIRVGAATDDDVHRFELEVRATAELTHPNTVRVFDYGATADGIWYYAMELLDPTDLEMLVRDGGPLSPRRALRMVTQAAQALSEAHERGIVHRDLKPSNLLVQRAGDPGEYVKLIDFGIARRVDSAGITKTGLVMGTPGYIAPETIVGGVADARSDVYALGAVLFYALAGRGPFDADNIRALAMAHVANDVPSISSFTARSTPPALEAVVARCLAKEPRLRHADGGELAAALLACDLEETDESDDRDEPPIVTAELTPISRG